MDLILSVLELVGWSAKRDLQTDAPPEWIALVTANKEKMITLIRDIVQNGGAIFSGLTSVVSKLAGAET